MTRSTQKRPWDYFLIFCAANAFIAYGLESSSARGAAALLGILLPFFLYFSSPPTKEDPATSWTSPSLEIPLWIFFLFLGLGLLLRIATGETLSVWPVWDDGTDSYFAIQRMGHWDWSPWYHREHDPALSIWLESLYFRLIPPSLFSMWLYPALLSTLTLFLCYWACRQFAPRAFSVLFTCLLAIGFWPVYLSQFCVEPQIGSVWEPLAIGLLGLYLKNVQQRRLAWLEFLLGLVLAGGLFTWFAAPALILLILAALFASSFLAPIRRPPSIFFALGFAIPALWLGPGTFGNFFGGHIHEYALWKGVDGAWGDRLKVPLDYLASLLWGPWTGRYFCFGPLWGGFLNPILGSFFLLGLGELRDPKERRSLGWALGGLGLCLLPGLASGNLEMFRIALALPFAFFFAALGVTRLARTPTHRPALGWFLCLALISLGLDLFHLCGPYHRWAVPQMENSFFKSPERYRCFPILKREARTRGPGWILTEFVPNISDRSLLVAAFPFNAAVNRRLDPQRSQWMGVLVSEPQKKYLARAFPNFRWYSLSTDQLQYDDSLYLGIISLTEKTLPRFEPWLRLNRDLLDLYPRMPFGRGATDYGPLLSGLLPLHREYRSDPFLEACLREKTANIEFSSGHLDQFLTLARPLLGTDFAFGLLYRRAGAAFLSQGKTFEAVDSLKKAARLNPHHRAPDEIMGRLGLPPVE